MFTPPERALLFVGFANLLQKNGMGIFVSLMTFVVVIAMRIDTTNELTIILSALLILTYGGILLQRGQPVVLLGFTKKKVSRTWSLRG